MNDSTADPSRFLRNSLRANAMFSSLSGATFALAGSSIASFLGVEPAWLVSGVGVNLLGFAALLFYVASRPQPSAPIAMGIIAADLGWVLGTALLVFGDVFTREGAAAAIAIANVVLAFAVLQFVGVRRQSGAPAAA